MKPEELRIGNYVYDPSFADQWTIVDIDFFVAIFEEKTRIEDIEPIPLTEQWLLDFGFVKKSNVYKLKNFGKFIFFDDLNTFGFYPAGLLQSLLISDLLKFVHQLQNLYFALTGKELTKKQ